MHAKICRGGEIPRSDLLRNDRTVNVLDITAPSITGRHLVCINIETNDHSTTPRELERERKPDISQADDRDPYHLQRIRRSVDILVIMIRIQYSTVIHDLPDHRRLCKRMRSSIRLSKRRIAREWTHVKPGLSPTLRST
jgi:hypothetical protein